MDGLPNQLAANELNEVPHRVREDLNSFKEWLSKQLHLNARQDEKWLLNILRCSKWNIEKAKKKIDFYYTVKTKSPEIFKNRNPFLPPFQHIFERNIVSILEPHTCDSPVVVVCKAMRADPNSLNTKDSIRFTTMLLDILSNQYVNSLAAIIDLQDVSPEYVKQITPTILKKLLTCVLIAYPGRLNAVFFVNVPVIFTIFINIVKSLVSPKMLERIHFISDDGMQTIQNLIPLSIIPSDFGGTAPPLTSCKEFAQHIVKITFLKILAKVQLLMESYADWFIDEEQYCCDETKRSVTRKLDTDLFGIDGSFRKLDFD